MHFEKFDDLSGKPIKEIFGISAKVTPHFEKHLVQSRSEQ